MSWRGVPVFGLVLLAVAVLMLCPAVYALRLGDMRVAAGFGYSAIVTAAAGLLLSMALRRHGPGGERGATGEFATLLAVLVLAPIAAAAPVMVATPFLSFEAAYFEMVSMITTTGATVFDRLAEAHPAVILWRGIVAWLGGLIALVMAWAILAPRSLGGFEVRGDSGRSAAIGRLRGDPAWAGGRESEAAGDRFAAAVNSVLPVYTALTFVAALALIALGHSPLSAAVIAAGLLSTSGVGVADGATFAASGFPGEAVAALALVLAATRHAYGGVGQRPMRLGAMPADPEVRLLAVVVLTVALWLFLRHWIGALELAEGDSHGSLRAFWGALFTALSFATTTGYLSEYWGAARAWSGLDNPSIVFFGLAIMGGGIATTAGGVKLLRAYALFKHGVRELERLVRPSSIHGSGAGRRGLRREGAQIAWVFVMFFVLALAMTMIGLSLTGLEFETGLAAAVAALSNTGPLFPAATGESWLTSVTPQGRAVLMVAMVLGRVEILALIAMLNTENWR